MQSIHPYFSYTLQYLQTEVITFSKHQYFQQTVILIISILAFVVGRLSHEKKLTHLIDMINDSDKTRKKVSNKLSEAMSSGRWIESKKKLLVIVSLLAIVGCVTHFYLTQTFLVEMYVIVGLSLLLMWILFLIRLKYLRWQKANLEKRMARTNMAAQTQLKQILQIFGKGLQNKLKLNYQQQIDQAQAKQAAQQCKMHKCYNEKKHFNDLFSLYEQIYDDIKQINLCDACLQQKNISTIELGLNEFDGRIKMYQKNGQRIQSMNLQNKKEMVNAMLKDFQEMSGKLNRICRRGCCIKQRHLIEQAKSKYIDRLRRLSVSN